MAATTLPPHLLNSPPTIILSLMFSQYLFDHKYDIDDLIAALCNPTPVWLETRTGTLAGTEPQTVPASHRFLIEPLPASFLTEIATSGDMLRQPSHLSGADKSTLTNLLATITVSQLPEHFADGRIGGWLRERVKDAALEWLDGNDLIPPSMRHINRQKAAKLYASRNVTIEEIE